MCLSYICHDSWPKMSHSILQLLNIHVVVEMSTLSISNLSLCLAFEKCILPYCITNVWDLQALWEQIQNIIKLYDVIHSIWLVFYLASLLSWLFVCIIISSCPNAWISSQDGSEWFGRFYNLYIHSNIQYQKLKCNII